MDTTEAGTLPAAPGTTHQVHLPSPSTCPLRRVSSAENVLPTPSKGSSARECPSPQVSDICSEDTHSSMEQPIVDQCYASLIPWTSKLTAPGYVPLAEPAADAMPISLDVSEDHVSPLTVPSANFGTQFWTPGPHQTFGHRRSSSQTNHFDYQHLWNGPSKENLLTSSTHGQKSEYKMQSNKENRFRRTAEALQRSGLWEVAMKTGSLIQRNRELQKELEDFRSDAIVFLKSVIKNPQNREFIRHVLSTALTSSGSIRQGSSVMTLVVTAAAAAVSSSVNIDASRDNSSEVNLCPGFSC